MQLLRWCLSLGTITRLCVHGFLQTACRGATTGNEHRRVSGRGAAVQSDAAEGQWPRRGHLCHLRERCSQYIRYLYLFVHLCLSFHSMIRIYDYVFFPGLQAQRSEASIAKSVCRRRWGWPLQPCQAKGSSSGTNLTKLPFDSAGFLRFWQIIFHEAPLHQTVILIRNSPENYTPFTALFLFAFVPSVGASRQRRLVTGFNISYWSFILKIQQMPINVYLHHTLFPCHWGSPKVALTKSLNDDCLRFQQCKDTKGESFFPTDCEIVLVWKHMLATGSAVSVSNEPNSRF